jgi:hypothetical protein
LDADSPRDRKTTLCCKSPTATKVLTYCIDIARRRTIIAKRQSDHQLTQVVETWSEAVAV